MKSIIFYVITAYFKCIYNGICNANLLIKTYNRLITSLCAFRLREFMLLAQGQRLCLKNG